MPVSNPPEGACFVAGSSAAPASRPSARALDAHRSVRYDGLLQLVEEAQQKQTITDIAKVAALRWKNCASVANWRLLAVYRDRCLLVVAIGREVSVRELALDDLPPYDAELWRKRLPRHLVMPALEEQRGPLPPELADPRGQAMSVLPIQRGSTTVAMLSVLSMEQAFDAMDKKFNKLIGTTLGTLVAAKLAEQIMGAELLAAEKAQAESELMRATMDAAVLGMVITLPGAHGYIIDANTAMCRMARRSLGRLVHATHMPGLLEPAHLPAFEAMVQALMERQTEHASIDAWLDTGEGQRLPVQLTGAIIWTPDGVPRMNVFQLMDLTERHAVERQKSEFVATVSHELKTPLTAVIAATALFKGRFCEQVHPRGMELLGNVERNSQRLLRLVEDLLDLETIAAGQMQLGLEPTGLIDALRLVENNALSAAEKAGVALKLGGPWPDLRLVAAPKRLVQVLGNLVSNAIKFSPSGTKVRLAVEVLGEQVEISVIDQGPGVNEAFRHQLFKKFTQQDGSQNRGKSGAGLGLAVSKALVELMQGEIGFDTETGQGSRFWLRLPLVMPAQANGHSSAGSQSSITPAVGV